MLVKLDSVTKCYGERAVLDGIDFEVSAAEKLAIVGPSGSGKSTLLNIIGLLDSPDKGTYKLGEREVDGLTEKERAVIRGRDLGFIFQLHHLLPQLNVLENVTLPAHALEEKPDWPEVEARGRKLLERVGLGEHMEKLPAQLSGGERQRAAVVRSLINGPKLLLADEPTGALDRDNADALTSLLLSINEDEGVALVVVTHDGKVADAIGPIWELDGKGKIRKR